MKVIGYVRASTEEQEITLDAQRDKLTKYAATYDLVLIETIVDSGESGKSIDRPGIQRALKLLRDGEAEGLCVAKLDRLTRNPGDWSTLLSDYFGERAKYRKKLFSVAESVNTASCSGIFMLSVLIAVAEFERLLIVERTREALDQLRRTGKRIGATPYGFDLADDGKSLLTNEVEQATIRLMQSLRGDGMSYAKIADELAARNVSSKTGGTWNASTVGRILRRAS